ncbi:MAG: hypothetical protein AB1585_10670 [Thermodesulfobacteriota bacterium]
MEQKWDVELWDSEEVLTIPEATKEVLERMLTLEGEKLPKFIKIGGEILAVNKIARIRRTRKWN